MLTEMVLQTEIPPLYQDESGAVRVGDSRVLLELVIHAFENGETPESIAQQYATTTLADIYGVIAYYLRHQDEVAAYLSAREHKAKEVRKRIEREQKDLSNLRERLLAQRDARG